MLEAPPSIEELVGAIHPALQWEIVDEFGGKSLDAVRKRLNEIECTWILEPYGRLQGTGFVYYFQVFEEYARSPDSEYDYVFPGQFAMAVELQIMHRPEQAFKIEGDIRRACEFIMQNLQKFYDDDTNWATSTSEIYDSIFRRLDASDKQSGEQTVDGNPH